MPRELHAVEMLPVQLSGAAPLAPIAWKHGQLVGSPFQRGDATRIGRTAIVRHVGATRPHQNSNRRGAIVVVALHLAPCIFGKFVGALAIVVGRGRRKGRVGEPPCIFHHYRVCLERRCELLRAYRHTARAYPHVGCVVKRVSPPRGVKLACARPVCPLSCLSVCCRVRVAT